MLGNVSGRRLLGWALLITVLFVAVSCRARRTESVRVPGGDIGRGQELIVLYGCSCCHTIPGNRHAQGLIGPPLTDWADRVYIAGRLTNEPDSLIRWIQFPQEVDPGNAMPDMGVTPDDARDIAAYLYTFRRDGRRSSLGGERATGAGLTGDVAVASSGVTEVAGGGKEADGG